MTAPTPQQKRTLTKELANRMTGFDYPLKDFRELIAKGANIKYRDADGNNLVHLSLRHKCADIFNDLVARDALRPLWTAKNKNDEMPVFIAVAYGKVAAFETLVARHDDKSYLIMNASSGKYLIHYAIGPGADILRRVIKVGANVNQPCRQTRVTPINLASRINDLTSARILLENGALPDVQAYTGDDALINAVKNDSDDMIRLLAAGGADIHAARPLRSMPLSSSAHILSPLECAVQGGHLTALHTLMDLGANPYATPPMPETKPTDTAIRPQGDNAFAQARAAGKHDIARIIEDICFRRMRTHGMNVTGGTPRPGRLRIKRNGGPS